MGKIICLGAVMLNLCESNNLASNCKEKVKEWQGKVENVKSWEKV